MYDVTKGQDTCLKLVATSAPEGWLCPLTLPLSKHWKHPFQHEAKNQQADANRGLNVLFYGDLEFLNNSSH